MNIANHIHTDNIEVIRSKYLKALQKWDIQQSRLFCEPQLVRFDGMTEEDRDRYIAAEVMNWVPNTPDSEFYITQDNFVRMDSFKPSQEIASAFRVFEYTLIDDKTTLVPCGSGQGMFWAVYFEDIFVGVGKTAEMAICKASIVINDAVLMKMNVA